MCNVGPSIYDVSKIIIAHEHHHNYYTQLSLNIFAHSLDMYTILLHLLSYLPPHPPKRQKIKGCVVSQKCGALRVVLSSGVWWGYVEKHAHGRRHNGSVRVTQFHATHFITIIHFISLVNLMCTRDETFVSTFSRIRFYGGWLSRMLPNEMRIRIHTQ